MPTITRRAFLEGSAAAALAAALGLAGCGGGAGSGSGSSGSKKRVAMILNDGINDGGWGAASYQAMVAAAKQLGWETAYTENLAQSEWVTALQGYAGDGYDLVFAPSGSFDDAVKQVAQDNPDTKFAILSSHVKTDNIESMLPDTDEIGYLAGSLAALLSKTGSIAFVGGVELDTTVAKARAYEKAAKLVNPQIKVSTVYAGSYTDVAKGKEIAESMVTGKQVDVIYGDASAVDSGVREALQAHPGALNIAQPSDLGGKDDAVIATSVVTDNTVMLVQAMKDAEGDSFGNKIVDGTIKNGAIKIGTFSDKAVPADVQKKFAEYEAQIKDGTFGK